MTIKTLARLAQDIVLIHRAHISINMKQEPREHEPLLPPEPSASAGTFFNDGPRRRQDNGWTIAYVVSLLATTAVGITLLYTGAPDFWRLISDEHLSDPASCPVDSKAGRRLLSEDDDHPSVTALAAHPLGALGTTLVGSIAVGCLFLLGFRHHAHHMIKFALALQVAIPLAVGGICLAYGQMGGGIVALVVAGLYIWLFAMWRDQIALVGRLLGISGHALVDNPGLIGLGLITPMVWGALLVPAGIFAYGAITNGDVVPNSSRQGAPVPDHDTGKLQCLDEDGNPVRCCSWQVHPAASAYLALLGVALTWTSMLMSQIKLFTTAGAVAQWYFQPSQPSSSNGARKGSTGGSRVLRSLGHALGPSFGSLCAAAAVLTVIQYLRQALDACERQAQQENKLVAFVAAILAFILRVILALVEFLTRFTTVRMAMTGEAFVDAAHGAVALLKRNAMDAFGIWWLPPFILQNCALMVSVLFGFGLWGGGQLLFKTQDSHDMSAIALGVIGGVVALLVISFFAGILLNVLDGVFMCFAVDRDAARVTREEVHVVLKDVPGVGPPAVVQQPDGGLAYGEHEIYERV